MKDAIPIASLGLKAIDPRQFRKVVHPLGDVGMAMAEDGAEDASVEKRVQFQCDTNIKMLDDDLDEISKRTISLNKTSILQVDSKCSVFLCSYFAWFVSAIIIRVICSPICLSPAGCYLAAVQGECEGVNRGRVRHVLDWARQAIRARTACQVHRHGAGSRTSQDIRGWHAWFSGRLRVRRASPPLSPPLPPPHPPTPRLRV
jgi:hypothetical protein